MAVDRHYLKKEVKVVNENLKKEMAPWLRVLAILVASQNSSQFPMAFSRLTILCSSNSRRSNAFCSLKASSTHMMYLQINHS